MAHTGGVNSRRGDGPGPGTWEVEHRSGPAAELHADDVPARRLVRVHDVTAPAVVLGSTQPLDSLDADALARAGVEVARRRSGGGAVLLLPGAQVWVDVVVPAGDPLWADDVCRASWWLGEAWASALGRGEVHRAGVTDRALGRLACFAAVGPGEVVADGRKVVGLSQRRTRDLARFQCVAYASWDPEVLLGLLAGAVRSPGMDEALRGRAGPAVTPGWDPVAQLLPHLPD